MSSAAAVSLHPLDSPRWRGLEQVLLDDPCDFMPQRVARSSRSRPWRGLGVWLQEGPVEDLYVPPMRKHCLVIRRNSATRLMGCVGAQLRHAEWLPGQVMIVPAATPSFWRSDEGRDNLHLTLDPAWLLRAAGDVQGPPPQLRGGFGVHDPLLNRFGHLLLDSLDSNASLYPSFAEAQALCLATHLLEHHCVVEASARHTGALAKRQLTQVHDAIVAELDADWSLECMAALLQLSPFHFARAFKAASGETPHRYLMRLRLEHARHLVLSTEQRLIDIAVAAGFGSLSHFGQTFRRFWGCSPGQLRRQA